MEFALSDDHRMLRETVRDICARDLEPIAQQIEANRRFPTETLEELAALDLLGVPIDTADGGLGGDTLMATLVAEELGRVSAAIGYTYTAHVTLGACPIERNGTQAQKRRWLEPLASGATLGTWAIGEAERTVDPAQLETTAERDGDEWILEGTKQFVTNASRADTLLVTAKTGTERSTFVLESGDDGIDVSQPREKLGLNAAPTSTVIFESVHLPADRLLGEPGTGWEQLTQAIDDARLSVAAIATGLAQGAFDLVSDETLDPRLVELYRKIDRARVVTYRGAQAADTGDRITREAALANLEATETAREVASVAIDCLGHEGYTSHQRFYRDAKLLEILHGAPKSKRAGIGQEPRQ